MWSNINNLSLYCQFTKSKWLIYFETKGQRPSTLCRDYSFYIIHLYFTLMFRRIPNVFINNKPANYAMLWHFTESCMIDLVMQCLTWFSVKKNTFAQRTIMNNEIETIYHSSCTEIADRSLHLTTFPASHHESQDTRITINDSLMTFLINILFKIKTFNNTGYTT